MPTFAFTGRNHLGEVINGERAADNLPALRQLLRAEKVMLTTANEKKGQISLFKTRKKSKVSAKELSIFTRQFSVMIDAGLPLVQCLDIIAQQQDNSFFQQAINRVRQDVEEGSTLAAALAKQPKVFDSLYVNMVEAGEAGGILDLILQRLSTYIEKAVKLKRDVVSALIYPSAVIIIAVVVVSVIMVVVIPQFEQIFLGLLGPGEQLPLPTRIVTGISGFLAGWGGFGLLVLIVASAFGLYKYYQTPKGRYVIDGFSLKIPIVGAILQKIAIARFSRTLSTLLGAGVPILQSLDITARTAGNVIIEEAITKVRSAVERGETVADPLRGTGVFPNMVGQMVGIGEQTGALDSMLGKVADFYEQEVDSAIANLLTLIEPLMIGFLGVTIGGIVIAMYLPLFTLVGKLANGGK